MSKEKKALIIFWSKTGNTEKVANAIKQGLKDSNFTTIITKLNEAKNIDFFNYDLVCIGAPSYSWHLPQPMAKYLQKMFIFYRKQNRVKLTAPKIPGKNVLIFVTYSGPHTGINEATPVGKDIRQFFEHIGFNIIDEWYILSEFHGSLEYNTKGKMGDIRGKPTKEELQIITENTKLLANIV